MKNVVFILSKSEHTVPQVDWAIREYIDPGIHQVLLVYILPERLFLFGDYRALSRTLCISVHGDDVRRKLARDHLESIRRVLLCEFSGRLCVTKLVICGAEYSKLSPTLRALETSMVILGPDTVETGALTLFKGSIDEFIVERLKIPVLRVPGRKKT